MALPPSGPISFNNINVELGVSGTTQASLGQASYRALAGVPSGAISMSNFYGKANQFAFTISSNQTNANLRTLAVNAGWNQSSKVVATIAGGVQIYSTSTAVPALTVNGSFPGGVDLINSGTIVGAGGAGGQGSKADGQSFPGIFGIPGTGGGTALSVSTAISINNAGTISGGGGGGGGGQLGSDCCYDYGAGGGGGGNGYGAGGKFGNGSYNGQYGSAGGLLTGGSGGPGYSSGNRGGTGGAGGSYAASGSNGGGGAPGFGAAGSGGAGGAAVSGNGNITWLAFGTRYGSIS